MQLPLKMFDNANPNFTLFDTSKFTFKMLIHIFAAKLEQNKNSDDNKCPFNIKTRISLSEETNRPCNLLVARRRFVLLIESPMLTIFYKLFCSIPQLFSRTSTKAEHDLSSLYGLFLCVE